MGVSPVNVLPPRAGGSRNVFSGLRVVGLALRQIVDAAGVVSRDCPACLCVFCVGPLRGLPLQWWVPSPVWVPCRVPPPPVGGPL